MLTEVYEPGLLNEQRLKLFVASASYQLIKQPIFIQFGVDPFDRRECRLAHDMEKQFENNMVMSDLKCLLDENHDENVVTLESSTHYSQTAD